MNEEEQVGLLSEAEAEAETEEPEKMMETNLCSEGGETKPGSASVEVANGATVDIVKSPEPEEINSYDVSSFNDHFSL